MLQFEFINSNILSKTYLDQSLNIVSRVRLMGIPLVHIMTSIR